MPIPLGSLLFELCLVGWLVFSSAFVCCMTEQFTSLEQQYYPLTVAEGLEVEELTLFLTTIRQETQVQEEWKGRNRFSWHTGS